MIPFVLVALLSQSPAIGATGNSYALIVTNNRSLTSTRPDLRYADDDGINYASLFSDYFGKEHITLLTQLDDDTRKVAPAWAAQVESPTLANLAKAVKDIQDKVSRHLAGTAEVYLVFAGHGDIDRGQGYLELADGRLTARDLEERVVKKLLSARLHLVLDSCNSFYMLNPRKPGGKRWQATTEASGGLLTRYPNVGALLSTSSEAVTYEWSELQSGIFSYEVRSGLRGAADADGDGAITYDELSAFIHVANAPVTNELYRPKVFSSAPGRDGKTPVLRTPAAYAHRLQVPEGTKRFTIRDASGVRILDVHKESKTAFSLALPLARDLGLYEEKRGDGRPVLVYRDIPSSFAGSLQELKETKPQLAARGEAPVFAALFTQPFGPSALAQFQSGTNPSAEVPPKPLLEAPRPVPGSRDLNVASVFWTAGASLDEATRETMSALIAHQLRKQGLQTRDDPRLLDPHALDVQSQRLAAELNAGRMFGVSVGKLGRKYIFGFEEVNPATMTSIAEASITGEIEEADILLPRLVQSVLKRVPLDKTETMRSVASQDARPLVKKTGERLWALGLPFGLTGGSTRGSFGLSLSWMYETTNFRLGATGIGVFGDRTSAGVLAIEGGWLPLDGAWSPFLSAGVGYMGQFSGGGALGDVSGNGAGFTAEAGAEFFRLHGTRLMVGAQALLPAYLATGSSGNRWFPVFLLHTRIAF